MARLNTAAALVVIGLWAGGCTYAATNGLSPHRNASISSVNQPVVQRTDYVFDVAAAGSVPSPEIARLDAWFQSLSVGYGDRISIDGYADDGARQDIARLAGTYGLLLSEGAPTTAGQIPPGSVRVIVSRSSASVPGCPQWNPSEIGARITTSPNYGCAVNTNIAAMIANPNDLVIGQVGDASVDAATAARAIQTYRTKQPTGAGPLKQEATKGDGQ